jgi:hypothetical protein
MDRDANYVAVGAFVMLAIALATGFVLWYTDAEGKHDYQRYEIYFEGTVAGLTEGSPGPPAGLWHSASNIPSSAPHRRISTGF